MEAHRQIKERIGIALLGCVQHNTENKGKTERLQNGPQDANCGLFVANQKFSPDED